MLNTSELQNILKPIINDQLLKFPIIMQAYIGTFMKRTTFDFKKMKTKEGRKNPNVGIGTLRILKGNLFRSFSKGDTNNIYRISNSGTTYELEFGSSVKYALIHEYGGRNMPARPYFAPAIDKFKSTNKFKEDVKANVIKGIRAWQENQRRSQA
jgi:phage gpG-like protein